MITRVLTSRLPNHADSLGDFIQDSVAEARKADQGGPVIYIYDGRGNQITGAALEEETLTDGSKVYNLHLNSE